MFSASQTHRFVHMGRHCGGPASLLPSPLRLTSVRNSNNPLPRTRTTRCYLGGNLDEATNAAAALSSSSSSLSSSSSIASLTSHNSNSVINISSSRAMSVSSGAAAAVRDDDMSSSVGDVDDNSIAAGDGNDVTTEEDEGLGEGEEGEGARCLLCDVELDGDTSFAEHSATAQHVARYAVCQTLVNPEKHAAMMGQLWDHLRLDFDAIDEANALRIQRRRRRLTGTLKHLAESNVIQHSLPMLAVATTSQQPDNTNDTTTNQQHKDNRLNLPPTKLQLYPAFPSLIMVGEAHARFVLMDRIARLFPKMPAVELDACLAVMQQRHTLDYMYDALDVHAVTAVSLKRSLALCVRSSMTPTSGSSGSSDPAAAAAMAAAEQAKRLQTVSLVKQTVTRVGREDISDEQRAAILMAVLGELRLFLQKDRPKVLGSKEAADALVLDVLATHASENMLSEILHYTIQKMVDEGTPVWREFKHSLANQALKVPDIGRLKKWPDFVPSSSVASSSSSPPSSPSEDNTEAAAARTTAGESLQPSQQQRHRRRRPPPPTLTEAAIWGHYRLSGSSSSSNSPTKKVDITGVDSHRNKSGIVDMEDMYSRVMELAKVRPVSTPRPVFKGMMKIGNVEPSVTRPIYSGAVFAPTFPRLIPLKKKQH